MHDWKWEEEKWARLYWAYERAMKAMVRHPAAVARLIAPPSFIRAPARVHRTTQQLACW